MLEAKNIGLIYRDGCEDREILKKINVRFENKNFYALLGPSGSGKSSLIYILSLLRAPTSGSIVLDGNIINNKKDNYSTRYENFGFIFQQHFLISHLNVLENVCYANYNSKIIKEEAIDILDELGLSDHIKKKPFQLSGGQRQRVAIARALVKKPKYIFADEPTASLDHDTAVNVMNIMQRYSNSATIICATHDISVLPEGTKTYYLSNGRIKKEKI